MFAALVSIVESCPNDTCAEMMGVLISFADRASKSRQHLQPLEQVQSTTYLKEPIRLLVKWTCLPHDSHFHKMLGGLRVISTWMCSSRELACLCVEIAEEQAPVEFCGIFVPPFFKMLLSGICNVTAKATADDGRHSMISSWLDTHVWAVVWKNMGGFEHVHDDDGNQQQHRSSSQHRTCMACSADSNDTWTAQQDVQCLLFRIFVTLTYHDRNMCNVLLSQNIIAILKKGSVSFHRVPVSELCPPCDLMTDHFCTVVAFCLVLRKYVLPLCISDGIGPDIMSATASSKFDVVKRCVSWLSFQLMNAGVALEDGELDIELVKVVMHWVIHTLFAYIGCSNDMLNLALGNCGWRRTQAHFYTNTESVETFRMRVNIIHFFTSIHTKRTNCTLKDLVSRNMRVDFLLGSLKCVGGKLNKRWTQNQPHISTCLEILTMLNRCLRRKRQEDHTFAATAVVQHQVLHFVVDTNCVESLLGDARLAMSFVRFIHVLTSFPASFKTVHWQPFQPIEAPPWWNDIRSIVDQHCLHFFLKMIQDKAASSKLFIWSCDIISTIFATLPNEHKGKKYDDAFSLLVRFLQTKIEDCCQPITYKRKLDQNGEAEAFKVGTTQNNGVLLQASFFSIIYQIGASSQPWRSIVTHNKAFNFALQFQLKKCAQKLLDTSKEENLQQDSASVLSYIEIAGEISAVMDLIYSSFYQKLRLLDTKGAITASTTNGYERDPKCFENLSGIFDCLYIITAYAITQCAWFNHQKWQTSSIVDSIFKNVRCVLTLISYDKYRSLPLLVRHHDWLGLIIKMARPQRVNDPHFFMKSDERNEDNNIVKAASEIYNILWECNKIQMSEALMLMKCDAGDKNLD
jgi:hypothetical protein